MSIGDCTRKRRFIDPARQQYYARYRTIRFARFLGFVQNHQIDSSPTISQLVQNVQYHNDGKIT